LAIIATLPTGVIGLTFKDFFEEKFGQPLWIGTCLIATGFLLSVTAVVPRGTRGWRQFHPWQALLVGLAQSLAILPGISRSGSTICTALFLGIRRRWAGEFSFLIAMPAILGATALQIRSTLRLPVEDLASLQRGPILLGGAVSLVVGVFALNILLASLRRAKLHYFAPYCWVLGITVLVVAW
jgi:undecaprenyl-diphosphatase